MGIGPHDDLGLADPGRMFSFQRALAKQEGAPKLLAGLSGGAFGKSSQRPSPISAQVDTGPSRAQQLPVSNLMESEQPQQQQQQQQQPQQQQQADNVREPSKMLESEPSSPQRPIDVRQFAPQQMQQAQQPQQAADQGGLSLPRVGSEADLKKLKLQPGKGFIGPDGQVHWVPFPGREAAA
jgi:hypothetical protein